MNEATNQIIEYSPFEAKLTEYKERYKGIVYDFTDSSQASTAKADKKAINKVIKELDIIHDVVKADVLVKSRLIDGERKRIKDDLIEIKDDITAQEYEHKNIAIKLAAELQQKVDDITAIGCYEEPPTLEALKKDLEQVKKIVLDDSFDTRKADAALAIVETTESIESKIALMEKRELEAKEEKEATAKAQADREEKIRVDTLKQAAKEKELALKQAEEEKQKAIKVEQEKAKQAAKEKEQAAHREVERLQAKANSESAKLLKKQNNQTHRAKVHKEIKESIMKTKLLGENEAIELVKVIMSGGIKNVTINY